MSEAYVRRLFDQYAARFDTALTERLAYRGPAVLRQAVEQAVHAAQRPLRFSAMLDLGCGTGLAGAAFAPLADRLVGVDLSPAMVAQAESKQLYDRLATGELAAFLKDELSKGERYDLVVAADVFVYVNDLAPVLAASAQVLAPGGVLAFTVETHPNEGVKLLQTLRYAHGEPYIQRALAGAGLTAASIAKAAVRSEKGVPVDSLVVIAVASTLPNVPVTFSR
jgi:predicted TPR repeat methyltransferase